MSTPQARPRCRCGHLKDDHQLQADRTYACEVVWGEDRCGCTAHQVPHIPRHRPRRTP